MHDPVRDRYLFSADRKVTEYRDVLEITPGHARLVTPTGTARALRWIGSLVVFVFYFAYAGIATISLMSPFSPAWLSGWPGLVLTIVAWLAGFVLLFWWWDRRTLPLLADTPLRSEELILVGARSFGTYQDVRARTLRGEELHLVVDVRAPRFWEAVGLLERKPSASG